MRKNMKDIWFSKILQIFFGLTGIILLIPLFIIMPSNRLAVDDFCYGSFTYSHGFWGAQINTWESWTGRFLATFLQIFVSMAAKGNGHLLTYTLFMIGSLLVGLFCLFMILTKKDIFQSLWITFLSAGSLYLITPNIGESFYWLSGSATYLWPLILLIFLIFFLLRKNQTKIILITEFLLAFGLAGGNETLTFLLCLVFLFLAFYKKTKSIYMAGGGLVIGFLIMYFAPGNSIRGTIFNGMSWPVVAVKMWKIGGWLFLKHYFFNIHIWQFIIIYFVACLYLFSLKPLKVSLKNAVYSLIIFILFIGVYVLPSLHVMGTLPPDRSDITLMFMLLTETLILAAAITTNWNFTKNPKFWSFFIFISLLAGLFGIYFSTKIELAQNYLIPKTYAGQYDIIYNDLKLDDVHQSKTVILPPLPISQPLHSASLSSDPKNWINVCLANYFKVGSIKISTK
jgi:hypothetical protein